MAKRRERLEEFKLYWQENLITYKPYGMNKAVELEKTMIKMRNHKTCLTLLIKLKLASRKDYSQVWS